MELLKITTYDQHLIPVYYFKNLTKDIPIGVIQIIHGMSEHSKYYRDFINYFNKLGYDIFIHDQRGHGTAVTELDQLGFIAQQDGAQVLIQDVILVTDLIKNHIKSKYPDYTLPLVLFGHSMGSVIALSAAMECHKYNKTYYDLLLLSGTPGIVPNWQCTLGKLLIQIEILRQYKKNIHAVSPISKFIVNYGLNFSFRKEKKLFAWATRDQEWLNKFLSDPIAAFVPQNQFWLDLIALFNNIKNPANINCIPKELPIIFLDGATDPVNNRTKQTLTLIKHLKQVGINNITHKVFAATRHHLCIEINRDIIFQELNTLLNILLIKKFHSEVQHQVIYEPQ